MRPAIVRRNSYDRVRAMEYHQTESVLMCDCGQEYMNDDSLKRHQQTNCKNRSIKCSFCSETFASSNLMRDHLLFCGNKTDECPRCRQLIRRSHFTYHYENKCAPINEIETPPNRIKNRSAQHMPTNLNKPFSRVDVPNNSYAQDYSGEKSLTNSPRETCRIPLPISTENDSSRIIKCEFCHNNCLRNDYTNHKDYCLRNPVNIGRKEPIAISSRSNQSQAISNGIVHIPCEICQQSIDLPNWSNHTQSCREREKQRLEKRMETISKEPLTERFPCEYCQQLCSAEQFHGHEQSCTKNPINMESFRNLAERPRPSNVILPIKRHNNQNNSISLKSRPANDPRFAHYQRIDIDRTHQANRSRHYDKNNNDYNAREISNGENLFPEENDTHRGRSYDNVSMKSNEDALQPLRADNIPRRTKSSDNLRNVYDNHGPRSNSNDYPLRQNHHRAKNDIYRDHKRSENMADDPIRPKVKPKQKSWFKGLFGCTFNTRGDN